MVYILNDILEIVSKHWFCIESDRLEKYFQNMHIHEAYGLPHSLAVSKYTMQQIYGIALSLCVCIVFGTAIPFRMLTKISILIYSLTKTNALSCCSVSFSLYQLDYEDFIQRKSIS